MPNEIILKKLDQISELLNELTKLLAVSYADFNQNLVNIRATERNFQLMVDLAVDINTQILLEMGKNTPDTYRQSFNDLGSALILPHSLAQQLSFSAGLRNILVHEYDFEEDYEKFYHSTKEFIPLYHTYAKNIYSYAKK